MVCMSLEQSSSLGPLDYKELFIRPAFSTTPSSDRYAMHVSVDMTTCPWKFNYGDHHISSTATRDSHDAAPTHGTTSPDVRLTPLGHTAPLPLCASHVGHLKCGEHQVSTIATRDSHDAARTHDTTRPLTCGSPLSAPLPL